MHVRLSKSVLSGNTVRPANYVFTADSNLGARLVADGGAVRHDRFLFDGDTAGYAKNWGAYLPLVASTAVTLDLTGLTVSVAGVTGAMPFGDTAFSLVSAIQISNLEAPGSGLTITVGNDGTANEFTGPIGVTNNAIVIQPGCSHVFQTLETAGWPVGTPKKLKINLTSTATRCAVYIGGA